MSKSEDSVISECGEYYFLGNGYVQVRLHSNGVGCEHTRCTGLAPCSISVSSPYSVHTYMWTVVWTKYELNRVNNLPKVENGSLN